MLLPEVKSVFAFVAWLFSVLKVISGGREVAPII